MVHQLFHIPVLKDFMGYQTSVIPLDCVGYLSSIIPLESDVVKYSLTSEEVLV